MSRYKPLRAALLTAAFTPFAAASFGRQPVAPDSADLTGKYELSGGGYLVVSVDDAGRVEGFFERNGHFGRVTGRADGASLTATWIQDSGAKVCASAVDGSQFWGKLSVARDEQGAVQTAWSDCGSASK